MFRDRTDAGRQLAPLLERFRERRPVVIGVPRGGVIVAAEVARALDAPLDIVVVRKLGAPEQPELGIGAVVDSRSPRVLLDPFLVERLGVSEGYIKEEVALQVEEIRRREEAYRGGEPPVPLRGRTVIVVDDGVATGASTRVALRSIRQDGPAALILAVPVGSPETLRSLGEEADEIVIIDQPDDFRAVGQFYADFAQTEDRDVIARLTEARDRAHRESKGREKGRSVA